MHSFTEAAAEAIAEVRAQWKGRDCYNATERMRVDQALDDVAEELARGMESYGGGPDTADILRAAGCTEQVVGFHTEDEPAPKPLTPGVKLFSFSPGDLT